ncbi:MAG: hypothetical protein LWW82_08175 [Comamonadaceae bacterium]|nr:hypothetical protein [Comamonadaceae bacterium]
MLEALFGAAKALIKAALGAAKEVVVETVKALEGTTTGKVLSHAVESWVRTKTQAAAQAQDLAAEEAEIGAKMARDGKLSPAEWGRVDEINEHRSQLRKQYAQADAAKLREALDHAGAVHAPVSADEIISTVGLLPHKTCQCGAMMAVSTTHTQQYGQWKNKFAWRCAVCGAREYFDPVKEAATIVRAPDADLDMPEAKRHEIWHAPATLADANARLRSHMGEADNEVLCPQHLLPMKIFPSLAANRGLVLDSYAYACVGMNPDGRGCTHRIPIDRLAITSAVLQRLEGRGLVQAGSPARKIHIGGVPV